LGAGCSFSSGIPTAGTLVDNVWLPKLKELETGDQENFNEWLKRKFSEYKKENAAQFYGEVIESLFPTPKERQREIERLVAKKDPGFGYAVLAQLMAEKCGKHCNIILTTNFDDMVADALYLYTNKKPIVIFHESLAGFVKISDTRPLVIKLHGDSKLSPHNTRTETKELDEKVKKVIKNLLSETGLIFIGYGGSDKSIINILKEVPEDEGSFQWGIYWVGQSIPNNEMGEFLKNRNAVWVNHRDFDELMLLIKEEFGLKTPSNERFEKLFKAYFDTLQNLNEKINLKPESGEKKILENAVENTSKEFKSWWSVQLEASKYWNTDPEKAEQVYQKGISQFPDSHELIGIYAVFLKNIRQDYDKAEELFKKALEIEPENANNLGNYANFLYKNRKDYEKAEEMYRKALENEPEFANNLENYAIFLKNIRKDYEKAEKLYRKALEIEPDNGNFLGNYAGYLLGRGYEENSFNLLKKAISFVDRQTTLIECWFYCYAHTKDDKYRNKSLCKIKDLIKSGVRSPYWNLEENVKTAVESGHPEPKFLEKLSRVISDEVDAKELDNFDVWLQCS
jgi:tetratricopeptide (TPR) repeat protein